jgi:hypothetical protein
MIAADASTSPCSASVAMRAGAPTFDLLHKTASTHARDRRHRDQIRGDRHQDSAFHRAILLWGHTAKALHPHREDNPDRPSRLQSP